MWGGKRVGGKTKKETEEKNCRDINNAMFIKSNFKIG